MANKSPMMIQVDLISSSKREMTTWVEKRYNLKPGMKVKLAYGLPEELKLDEWYDVIKVYDLEVAKDQLGKRGFDNNNYDKHDGTSLKDRLK